VNQLNKLLQILIDAEIRFVIVGGFAGVLHGSSLVTRDLDICSVLTDENIARLRHALRDLNPTHRISSARLSFLEDSSPGAKWNNLYLQTDLGALDILSSITGVGDFDRIDSNAVQIKLFDCDVRVISVDDLITAKEALGREKDKLAATELRAVREARMKPSTTVLIEAIENRHRLSFDYDGKPRLVEPQCYGVGKRGTELLRAHQLQGGSEREVLFDVQKIQHLEVTGERFGAPGPNYKKNDAAMTIIFAQL
jgi:hypothetical protein